MQGTDWLSSVCCHGTQVRPHGLSKHFSPPLEKEDVGFFGGLLGALKGRTNEMGLPWGLVHSSADQGSFPFLLETWVPASRGLLAVPSHVPCLEEGGAEWSGSSFLGCLSREGFGSLDPSVGCG